MKDEDVLRSFVFYYELYRKQMKIYEQSVWFNSFTLVSVKKLDYRGLNKERQRVLEDYYNKQTKGVAE